MCLARRLRPSKLKSLISRAEQAPRSAVVCVDCTVFSQSDAAGALSVTARNLRARLRDLCRLLGVHLPVYVLFTKLDRIPFFREYAGHLTNDEARQVLGATVAVKLGERSGVYAERETRRLTAVFDGIFHGLSQRRLSLLSRETESEPLPGIYEFPREFRKIGPSVVQFLVELCKPSQLNVGPFLRGFYFSGVRPVIVQDSPQLEAVTHKPSGVDLGSATMLLSAKDPSLQKVLTTSPGGSRKVPQWVFLSYFFNHILLQDRQAKGASTVSTRVSLARRAALALLTILSLVLLVGFTVSYFGNAGLQDRISQQVRALSQAGPQEGAPSLEALQHLDALRELLEELMFYRTEGRPLRLGWGLYSGDEIYESTYRLYHNHFDRVLLQSSRAQLVSSLQGVPEKPAEQVEEEHSYQRVYDRLKAHLIVTDFHQESSSNFLAPQLFQNWPGAADVDDQRADLAFRQFEFYSRYLSERDPYDFDSDQAAVEHSRNYLDQFAGFERLYQGLLSGNGAPDISFNAFYDARQPVLRSRKTVRGAFTRQGWIAVQALLADPSRFPAEEWVLGKAALSGEDIQNLEARLRQRYISDYIEEWKSFLDDAHVYRYAHAQDAALRLRRTADARSPLLALLWLAADHTSEGPEEVRATFQPASQMVPPAEESYISSNNREYVRALQDLQGAWEALAQAIGNQKFLPPETNPLLVGSIHSAAGTADAVARQVALDFRGDRAGRVSSLVRSIIEAPIRRTRSLLDLLSELPLDAGGAEFCAAFNPLWQKYPFDPNSSREATLQELSAVLAPGQGEMWKFYDEMLKNHLVKQGSSYQRNPDSSIQLRDDFVLFFNQAARVSQTFFAQGQPQANMTFTVTPQPIDTMDELDLNVGGQNLLSKRKGGSPKLLNWPGSNNQVRLVMTRRGVDFEISWDEGASPWSIFRFFFDAASVPPSGSGIYEWRPDVSGRPVRGEGGRPVVIRYRLDHGAGNAPVLKKGYLAGLSCVAKVKG